jgi:hypothetical protein
MSLPSLLPSLPPPSPSLSLSSHCHCHCPRVVIFTLLSSHHHLCIVVVALSSALSSSSCCCHHRRPVFTASSPPLSSLSPKPLPSHCGGHGQRVVASLSMSLHHLTTVVLASLVLAPHPACVVVISMDTQGSDWLVSTAVEWLRVHMGQWPRVLCQDSCESLQSMLAHQKLG